MVGGYSTFSVIMHENKKRNIVSRAQRPALLFKRRQRLKSPELKGRTGIEGCGDLGRCVSKFKLILILRIINVEAVTSGSYEYVP